MIFQVCGNIRRNVFFIFLLTLLLFSAANAQSSAPELFTYPELKTLYDQEIPPPELQKKLDLILTTPFVDNSYKNTDSRNFKQSAPLGSFLRVAEWNIERGLEYETIEALFESRARFEALLDPVRFPAGSRERSDILAEAELIRNADVIVFNEVDFGLKRTNYRHIAADLAAKLKMNYAFGAQFVELTPVNLSEQKTPENAEEKEFAELVKVDPNRYKGLHGVAILSRFPLENVRLIPFKHKPYDWYKSEKKGASLIEKGKRMLAKKVFLEESLREVRRGGRTTLLADVIDERLPSGRVTIAATHLENRTKSKSRVKQLNELLETIKPIANPVIVAGDMNSSGSDLTPTSIRRELMKRYGNPNYWIKTGIQYALGFGIAEDFFLSSIAFGRTYGDPTVRNIPFFSPNSGKKFFTTLQKFRFADGGAFDFRGEENRSFNHKSKTLANSNERGFKGFITTYQVKRTIYLVGKSKLDWIFVKPADLKNPRDEKASHRFAPHFGRTLINLNEVLENRISDHRPIIVDIPLGEPPSNQ